jgi:hypothetical protein
MTRFHERHHCAIAQSEQASDRFMLSFFVDAGFGALSSVSNGSFDGRLRNAHRTTLADLFKTVTMGAPTRESAVIGFANALANR